MQKIRSYLKAHWRLTLFLVGGTVVLFWLLLTSLGKLTGGLSQSEVNTLSVGLGWHGIYQNPLFLPLKLLGSAVRLFIKHPSQFALRLPSVTFGALTAVVVFRLLRLWYGARTAIYGVVLFVCSSWFLHVSRLATTDVIYLFALPTLLLSHAAIKRASHNKYIFYFNLLLWSVLLYIPGMIWFIAANIWLQRTVLKTAWVHHKVWWQRSLTLVLAVSWIPLLALAIKNSHVLLKTWLGLGEQLPTVTAFAQNIAGVFEQLLIRGPLQPDIWLARLPILDVFTLAMFGIGGYFYIRHWKAERTHTYATFAGIGVILISLGGPVTLSLLVPLLYLAAAGGVGYLLHEWLTVFPRNPLARATGMAVVLLAVALSCAYNLDRYYVAWPKNPATQATFTSTLKF